MRGADTGTLAARLAFFRMTADDQKLDGVALEKSFLVARVAEQVMRGGEFVLKNR